MHLHTNVFLAVWKKVVNRIHPLCYPTVFPSFLVSPSKIDEIEVLQKVNFVPTSFSIFTVEVLLSKAHILTAYYPAVQTVLTVKYLVFPNLAKA